MKAVWALAWSLGAASAWVWSVVLAALVSQVDLPTIERGVGSSRAGWRDENSLYVSLSGTAEVIRQDPALQTTWLPVDAQGALRPFFRKQLARKNEKRYSSFTVSPPSTSETGDRELLILIYDGNRSWSWRPADRNVYLKKGPMSPALPATNLYGELIGIPSAGQYADKTIKGNLPYPFDLDEVLASGQYVVAAEQAVADGVVCTRIERPGLDQIWLDPRRGYAIVQREWHWDIGQSLKARIINRDFREVLDGLWLPTRCRIEYYATSQTAPNEVCVVAELNVDKLEANISDDIFVPRLPARTMVQDYDLQTWWATPADITPPTLEKVIAKAGEYVYSSPPPKPWWRSSLVLFVTAALGLLLASGLAWVALRRHRRAAVKDAPG